MKIRKARQRDADVLAAAIVMAEGELVTFFTGHEDGERARGVLREFILSPVPCRYSLANALVADIDGEAAGAIFAFPANHQPELDLLLLASVNARGYNLKELFFEGEAGTYYLSTMGVDPNHRGKGVGTALIDAAEREGAKLGFERSSLLVATDKEKAKALYERLGYRTTMAVSMAGYRYYRMGKQLGLGQGGGVSSTTRGSGS